MKFSQTVKLASSVTIVLSLSSTLVSAADAVKGAKQAVTNAVKPVAETNDFSVKSGFLFALGKSDLSGFDAAEGLSALGYTGATGGSAVSKTDWSLGYRQAFGTLLSINAQYVRQNFNSDPIALTVTAGTEAAAAQNISENLPKLAQGIALTGLYHMPISPRLSSHVGGGAFIWKGERETRIGTVTATDKENGASAVLQIGLGYRVTSNIAVEGNVQRFLMPDEAVNRLSLGIVYSFR